MRWGTVSVFLAAMLAAPGCGSSDESRPAAGTAAGDQRSLGQIVAAQREEEIERDNRALARAAERGDRRAVSVIKGRLDVLARTLPMGGGTSSESTDGFDLALDGFAFKRGPLYAQRLTSERVAHRAFAGVFGAVFCLDSRAERRRAVADVYEDLDARMRAAGVSGFVLYVVPVGEQAPSASRALAVARGGRARLTAAGRACARGGG